MRNLHQAITLKRVLVLLATVLFLAGCGADLLTLTSPYQSHSDVRYLKGQGGASRGATVRVVPNPVEAGSIDITKPIVEVSGLRKGKMHWIYFLGAEDSPSALQNIGGHKSSDRFGKITWAFEQEGGTGYPDALLVPGTAQVVVKDMDWDREVARSTFEILPNPGTVEIAPNGASPGTERHFSGQGALPGARLAARWFDVTGCSCSRLLGCRLCTYVPMNLELTADQNGGFSGTFSPTASNGNYYCRRTLSIVDESTGLIVATKKYSLCPNIQF